MRSYVKTVHPYLIQANKKISLPVRRETTNFLWTFIQHKYFQVCWNALLAVVNAELLGRRWQLFFILKIVAEKQFSNKWFDSFRYRTGSISYTCWNRRERWELEPPGGGRVTPPPPAVRSLTVNIYHLRPTISWHCLWFTVIIVLTALLLSQVRCLLSQPIFAKQGQLLTGNRWLYSIAQWILAQTPRDRQPMMRNHWAMSPWPLVHDRYFPCRMDPSLILSCGSVHFLRIRVQLFFWKRIRI